MVSLMDQLIALLLAGIESMVGVYIGWQEWLVTTSYGGARSR